MKQSIINFRKLVFTLSVGCLMLPSLSNATTFREGSIGGDLIQHTENGVTEVCGVTFHAHERITSVSVRKVKGFNGHITLESTGGMLKGRASQVFYNPELGPSNEYRLEALATKNLWVKARQFKPTSPDLNNPIVKTDKDGFLAYLVEKDITQAILDAIIKREPIQIGAKLAGEERNFALFGIVKMSDLAISELKNCLNELEGSQ